jgi:SAM-dependent methyltransferase
MTSHKMPNEISASRVLEGIILGALDNGHTLALDGSLFEHIGPIVNQISTISEPPEDFLKQAFSEGKRELLDFGCGTGQYRPWLEEMGYNWRGLNYASGMQVEAFQQANKDPAIEFYDGLYLPYADATFDVVYSTFTFQCVQRIDISFGEIARVLKPSGKLIGQVAYNEPMQDFTTYNYTPYGFKLACVQAGLEVTRISPRYDVFTWMLRRLLIMSTASDDNSLSTILTPDNCIFEAMINYGKRIGLCARDINLLKLQFSAHYSFNVVKPGAA